MDGEIKAAGIAVKFESEVYEKKIVSADCVELKIKTKLRVKGWVKWLIELLQRR